MAATAPSPPPPGGALPADLALTALAPMAWGTTYVITTTLLPPDRPLLAATLRALPAGLLLLALAPRLPRGPWWPRLLVLAVLNFGAFFPLLFVAAYRLPGGVASTINALQPLLVAFFAFTVTRVRPRTASLVAAVTGAAGVGLMTLTAEARLDGTGILSMITALTLMSLAIVLNKKWGLPEGMGLLTFTAWQLSLGGVMLVPLTLAVEGLPASFTAENALGFTLMGSFGTALAYALWFRGIERLPATSVALLVLCNPLVATLAGFLILHQTLTPGQLTGFAVALGSLVAGQLSQAAATPDGEPRAAVSSGDRRALPATPRAAPPRPGRLRGLRRATGEPAPPSRR
ncbi:EamA family transporter [Actinocorallia populi]|uniref:EamA family transporter n=1 Tax=Actinocorallia populi TaxID=2079200 RepID=UPI000D0929D8|nr:EamA family transporter [Actinocorallia populi]